MKEIVRSLREQNNWTQEDLADRAGLSARTIQRIESGQSSPKGYTLKSLEEVFGQKLAAVNTLPDPLRIMNLSCLLMLIIPLGNLIFPYLIWRKNKNIEAVNVLGRRIINFQISWYLFASLLSLLLILIEPYFKINLIFWGLILAASFNVGYVLFNAARIHQNRRDVYKLGLKIL